MQYFNYTKDKRYRDLHIESKSAMLTVQCHLSDNNWLVVRESDAMGGT